MDGWMDGEVLIIGKVVGWSGGVPKGLVCVEVRPWSVICGGFFFQLIFERASGAFFFIFGAFWGVLGSHNGSQNRILRRFLQCFFRVRLGIDFLVIFSWFF